MIRIVRKRTLVELAEDTARIPGLLRRTEKAEALAGTYQAEAEAAKAALSAAEEAARLARADAAGFADDAASAGRVAGECRLELDALREQVARQREQDDLTATVMAARDLALEAAGFFRIRWASDEEDHQRAVISDALAIEKFICGGHWDADPAAVHAKITAVSRTLSNICVRGQKLDHQNGDYFRDWKNGHSYDVHTFLATAELYYTMLTGQSADAPAGAAQTDAW